MSEELTEHDIRTRRLQSCVNRFPGADTGEFSDKCCRFPKACSPYGNIEAVRAGNLTDADLEPADRTPIRMRNDGPISNQPILRDRPVVTETKHLTKMRVGSSFMVNVEMSDQTDMLSHELQRRRVDLEAYVLQEKLVDDYYEETAEFAVPRTWWDMFKDTYGHRWWLSWWAGPHGSKFDIVRHPVRVHVERFANYPEADIPIGQLGRPVPYERLRRMDDEEMQLQDDEATAIEQDAEKHNSIVVYLLVPETIDDLVNETGLEREWFEDAYEFDQHFGLQSKIYIVPEGGVN